MRTDARRWTCEADGALVTCERADPLRRGERDVVGVVAVIDREVDRGSVDVAVSLVLPDGAAPADRDTTDDTDSTRVRVRGAAAGTPDPVEELVEEAVTPQPDDPQPDDPQPGDPQPGDPQPDPSRPAAPRTEDGAGMLAQVAGTTGAAGAFAIALVLVAGRRRRTW